VPRKGDSGGLRLAQNEHDVRISRRTALAAAFLGLAILPLAWVGLAPAKTGSTLAGCGGARWAVKTLADPAGRALSLKPKPTTIRKLRRAHAPRRLGPRRTRGIERTTFRVTGRLVEMKLEDDLDINLVIADPRTGATMIAAFPSASCTTGATRKARAKMSRARAALVAACGAPTSSSRQLSGTGAITGVGFFDPVHGQAGAAPNGIELHPALAFTASSCGSVPEPPPPPPGDCAASYPDVCIPPPPPRLKCSDIPYANFVVRWDVPRPDPQHFDRDRDGVGCET
jgi:hypothetical protein